MVDEALLNLLADAIDELRSRPNDITTGYRFDWIHDLAAHLETSTSSLADGDLSVLGDLSVIFGPTGSWDDAGGTSDIANRLCEMLKSAQRASLVN